MSPLSTDKITNKRVTLKATIIASTNAQINESSIRFRLDGIDVTNSVKINKISKAEYTLIYQPEENLSSGQHKAEISFQDSASKSATKSWTFTITSEEDTSDIFTIFGYQIPKKTIIIVLVGILIVIIALIAPFIISSVWKEGTRATTGESYRGNPSLPHSALSGGSMYDSSTLQSETNSAVEEFKNLVNQKAITQEPSQNNKDIWNDNFFAPEPISNEEKDQPQVEQPVAENVIPQEEVKQEEEVQQVPVAQDQPQVEQPITENVIPQEEVKQEEKDIPIKQEEEVQQVPVAQDQPQVEQPIPENVIPQEEVKQEEKDIPIKQEEEGQQVPLAQDQPQVEQPIVENVIPQEEVKQEEKDIPIKQEDEGQQVPVAQDQPQVEQPIVENTLPQEEVVEQVPLEQPQIPEPEIPSSSDLQKIFEQIPNQEDTNSPTAP